MDAPPDQHFLQLVSRDSVHNTVDLLQSSEVNRVATMSPTCHNLSVNMTAPGAAGFSNSHGHILRSLLTDRQATAVPNGEQFVNNSGFSQQSFGCVDPHRPRSQSMGANFWVIPEVIPAASHDSLDCVDDCEASSVRDGNTVAVQTENLIEVARQKLMMLKTTGDDEHPYCGHDGRISSSQPGSPPHPESCVPDHVRQQRKYSEGSQLRARLQAMRMGFRTPVDVTSQDSSLGHPVDLSSRRRKRFDGVCGLPYARRFPATSSGNSVDEGIGDDCGSERSSILKSILIGRGRSNTISVCGSQARGESLTDVDVQRSGRQLVTLAKKNLHPVTAKISDCLNHIVAFVRSQPEFMTLSVADQRTIMSNTLHRLLLLFMAESNIHFVVVPLLQSADGNELDEEADSKLSAGYNPAVTVPDVAQSAEADLPTLQFAESVRSFISKCYALSISTEEYTLMRVITLFQSSAGSGALEMSSVVDKASAAARHNLQLLVESTHPHEALQRYSALLLTIHTLYGIHCGMLETLFCRPLAARNIGFSVDNQG